MCFQKFDSQTFLSVIDCPINTGPNPTIIVYDFFTGESKSFWNTEKNQKFTIPTKDSPLTNVIIYGDKGQSKSFFIRKNDEVAYDYNSKSIISSKYNYKDNDFKLTTISHFDNWQEQIDSLKISSDFSEIVALQNKISKLTFEEIPSSFPKGNPMFRLKLYQYLNKKYSLNTKLSNNKKLYNDYLKYIEKIYKDTSVDKKNLSQFIFTNLNAMVTATTKDDFVKAFGIFKTNTTDSNTVSYLENEYLLENKLVDKNIIGIIDGNKNQTKFEHIIKKNKGKYIVIDFWASWCAPCLVSIPKTIELGKKYGDSVSVIYLSLDRSFNPWKNAEGKHNIQKENSYLVVNGIQKDLVIDSQKIKDIPRYFLYNKEGKLIKSDIHNADEIISFLEKELE